MLKLKPLGELGKVSVTDITRMKTRGKELGEVFKRAEQTRGATPK